MSANSGLEVDGRSDLFSLGVLLYEMLTGRRPFEGSTTGDLLVSILSREPEPPPRLAGALSAEMQWVISKALRKDKTLRYQTARDLVIDLKNLAQGLHTRVLSPAPSPTERRCLVNRGLVTPGRADVRENTLIRSPCCRWSIRATILTSIIWPTESPKV